MKKVIYSFLKPYPSKVVLAFVLFLVFSPFIFYDNGIRCIRAPCPSESLGSVVNFLVFSYNNSHAHISLWLLIIGIIFAYLIACVLVILSFNKHYERFSKALGKRH